MGVKILLVNRSDVLFPLVEKGFRDAGTDVESLNLDGLDAPIPLGSLLRETAQHFTGKDLAVYVADEVTFGDGGGAYLRQVSSWAEQALVPVIVIASLCRISTRELRTLGVEAGYEAATDEDVRRVVQTWVR